MGLLIHAIQDKSWFPKFSFALFWMINENRTRCGVEEEAQEVAEARNTFLKVLQTKEGQTKLHKAEGEAADGGEVEALCPNLERRKIPRQRQQS